MKGIQGLATDGTAVWVLTETGFVRRIDPATNRAGPGTQTGATTDLYNDISVDENGVWVSDWDAPALYRLDRAGSKVVAVIDAGLAPKGLLATGAAVWVAATHDGKVLRIDPTTNAVVATVTVGRPGTSGPNWLASGFGSVWVGIPNDHTVVRIDPVRNAIQATIPTPLGVLPCGGFAILPTEVWSTGCDTVMGMTRIDPSTNRVVTKMTLDGHTYPQGVINGRFWMSIAPNAGAPALLGRFTSATSAIDLELSPGSAFGGGGGMVVAAGSVWVVDYGNDRILRLPLAAFTPG